MHAENVQARMRPGQFQLGAPIALHDLLALPGDGVDYTRDADGRLALMSPDDYPRHGLPVTRVSRFLNLQLAEPWFVAQERAVAFERVWNLRGELLPPSFLGPKSIEPDVAVFSKRPEFVTPSHGLGIMVPHGLALIVEVLSASTWRCDLGVGSADEPNRWRTYLEAGVPEYWILNAGMNEDCPVPSRSGKFLRAENGAWVEIPVESGVVRSQAIPGLALDLETFWKDCGL